MLENTAQTQPLLILNGRGQTKFRTTWLICVLVLLFPLAAHGQTGAGPKRVLVLYWYHKDYVWNVDFDRNFQAVLQSEPAGPFEYYPEYLETNRFPGEHQSRLLHDHLRQKYADRQIDVVVATSDASLNFLLKYRADLFPQAPIVFVGTRTPTTEQLAAGPGMTGLIILTDHRQTVDLALRLHPATKRLFIVSGTVERDKRVEALARKELQSYESRVAVEYGTDLRPEELVAKTKSLPEGSLILYVWQQSQNEQGKVLESLEILALIANSATVPVYTLSTPSYVGPGIVGGYINLAGATGAKAGEIATRVANGVRPQDIPVESAPLVPIFDWRELRRWGISEDLLPSGSVVRFKALSLWDQYRWQIIGIISLVLVEAFLIFALLAQRARRSRAEEGLRLSEDKFSKAFHASPEPISIYRYRDSVILEVNERWTSVYGFTREEAVGHTALELNLIEPEDREKIRGFLEKQHSIRELEVDLKTKQNEIRHISLSAEQIVIDNELSYIFLHRDITDRMRAEDELKESKRKLEEAQRIAHVGHWERDLDTDLITWSDEIYRIFGLPRRENDSPLTDWRHMLHPEDRERVSLAIDEAQRGGRRYDVEYRIMRPDGEVRYVHSHGDVISDEQGRPRRAFGIAQDITERKRAEEALSESQKQYETLVNTIDGIVWEVEAETLIFTFVSNQAERILGYPLAQWFEPNFWANHLHPDDRDWAVGFCIDATERRVDHQLEYRMLAADGRVVWLSDHVTVNVRDDNSVCLRGVMVDITERKLAEEALRKSENLWRTMFDNAAIGIALVNSEGRLVETNPAFQKLLGYTKEELRRLWFVDFTHPDDTIKEFPLHQEMIEGRRDHYQMEKRYIRKDGQVRWVNLIASIIPAEQPGEFFGVGMVEDITERKHAEEQLKTSTAQLRALSARLQSAREEEGTRIAREIHDELGGALTGLKWDLERINKILAGAENGGKIHSVQQKIPKMTVLIDSTIDTVRRISSELRPGVLDDLGLVAAIEWQAQQFQQRTGIKCTRNTGPKTVELSRDQATAVFRIFQEILTNVLRHAQATRVDVKMSANAGAFVLEVKDNGRGITEMEKTNTRSLGLAGMRERAHLIGGEVHIDGVGGRGTVVVVRVPMN